jgi:hypothetical protein
MLTSRLKKQTRGIAMALLLIVAVVVGQRLTTEPTFEGRSVSSWIDRLPSIDIGAAGRSESISIPGSGSLSTTEADAAADQARINQNIGKAHKALDAIVTNHLSMLVARLKLRDTTFKTTIWNWAERLRIIDDAHIRSAHFRRGQAMHAFAYLRARARPIVPQLLDLTTNQNADTQLSAWYALEAVAPDEFHKRKHPPIIEHAYGTQ